MYLVCIWMFAICDIWVHLNIACLHTRALEMTDFIFNKSNLIMQNAAV